MLRDMTVNESSSAWAGGVAALKNRAAISTKILFTLLVYSRYYSQMTASQIKVEVFDERQCILGEGPVASGPTHSEVQWVDIEGKKVLSRNLETGQSGEYSVPEDIGFVIPTESGKDLLGTASGPVLYDGKEFTPFVSRNEVDVTPMRWNDAKVDPAGDLWLGSMSYTEEGGHGALYRLKGKSKELTKFVPGTSISNGLAWSKDRKTFFYIDTLNFGVDAFDYSPEGITNRRLAVSFSQELGYPDGMCIDTEEGLWIAFYNGSAIRRFDTRNNFVMTHEIKMPAVRTTSCAFVGKNLDQLVITSAERNNPTSTANDGQTFICTPGFTGTPTTLFAGA
jgi:sugar lactone lactonase YvrE